MVWEAATGQERRTLIGHEGGVSAVAVNPTGQFGQAVDGESVGVDAGGAFEYFAIFGDGKDPVTLLIPAILSDKAVNVPGQVEPLRHA